MEILILSALIIAFYYFLSKDIIRECDKKPSNKDLAKNQAINDMINHDENVFLLKYDNFFKETQW